MNNSGSPFQRMVDFLLTDLEPVNERVIKLKFHPPRNLGNEVVEDLHKGGGV